MKIVVFGPEKRVGALEGEKVIDLTREELPYSVAVGIDRFEEGTSLSRIYATIHVDRENQKGIVGNQCRVDRTRTRRAAVSSEQEPRANLIHRRTADGRLNRRAGPCVIAELAAAKG